MFVYTPPVSDGELMESSNNEATMYGYRLARLILYTVTANTIALVNPNLLPYLAYLNRSMIAYISNDAG